MKMQKPDPESDPNPNPASLVSGTDPGIQIRIRTKCHGSVTLLSIFCVNHHMSDIRPSI